MQADPLISVIVPCYNQGEFLYDCVASIKEATKKAIEIIVINDGSTDGSTLAEFQRISEDPTIHLIHQSNAGLAAARNAGIKIARGCYIQLLDADDMICPGKIDIQIKHIIENDTDISISNYTTCDKGRNNYILGHGIEGFSFTVEDILFKWERGFSIPIHSALFRREIFESVRFGDELKAKEDWFFWATTFHRGFRAAFLNLPLAIYRIHGNNMTRNLPVMASYWVAATRRLRELFEDDYPHFWDESLKWLKDYYILDNQEQISKTIDEIVNFPRVNISEGQKNSPSPIADDDGYKVYPARLLQHSTFGIVIPVYNHSQYLEKCLESACGQNVGDLKVYAYNDGSSDPKCAAILHRFWERFDNLTVIEGHTNLGISHAQTVLVNHCDARFIGFLDCDDYLAPNAFERVRDCLERNADAAYFFSDRYNMYPDGRIKEVIKSIDQEILFNSNKIMPFSERILYQMFASHLKVIRKDAILDCEPFPDRLRGVQDYDLALKFSEKYKLCHIDTPIYFHRIHPDSQTNSNATLMFRHSNVARREAQFRRFQKLSPLGSVDALRRLFMTHGSLSKLVLGDLPLKGPRKFDFDKDKLIQLAEEDIQQQQGALYIFDHTGPYIADGIVELIQRDPTGTYVFWVPPGRPNQVVHFIREYNSLFDAIFVAQEEDANALQGHVYDSSIVISQLSLEIRD